MEQLCVIAEKHEGRRCDRRLCHIIYFQPSALICRRLNAHCSVCKHVVKHSRGNSHDRLTVNIFYLFKKRLDSLTGLCGNKYYRSVLHIPECLAHLHCIFVYRAVILFHGIPFIDDYDARLTGFVCDSGYFFVLLGHALVSVYHNKTNVGSFDRHMCSKNAVFFDFIVYFRLTANTGGINKRKFAVLVFHMSIDSVSCGSGNIGNNKSFRADYTVDYRGFSGIRLTDNGNLY